MGGLLTLHAGRHPDLDALRSRIESLTDLAVDVRYPGRSADALDAEEAVEIATEVRDVARSALGIA